MAAAGEHGHAEEGVGAVYPQARFVRARMWVLVTSERALDTAWSRV